MHLAQFIELFESKCGHKTEAAQQAVAELGAEDAYALLPVVSRLDPQVSMTTCVHRDLPTHARSALCYWLVRTSSDELMRLRDADHARITDLLSRPLIDTPVEEALFRQYLSTDEWTAFDTVRTGGSWEAWAATGAFEEVVRLRHELARQLGSATE